MANQLFILPTSEVAARHPTWMLAMEELNLPWEQFIGLAIDPILEHINRGGIEDVTLDNLEADQGDVAGDCTDTILDTFLSVEDELYQQYFHIVFAVVTDLIVMAYQYVPKVLSDCPHAGFPYEIQLHRVVGRDLSLRVQYLDLGCLPAAPLHPASPYLQRK